MRALKAVTIAMGVLIVGATLLLVVLITRRMTPARVNPMATLSQPPGTRLIGIAAAGANLAMALQGGGPDRILLLDSTTLKITATITVTQ